MRVTPFREIEKRVKLLQKHMTIKGLDAVLVMQSADLFYLSGTFQNAYLYIPQKGEPILMVRRLFERALELSPLKNILPLKSMKDIPSILKEYGFKDDCKLGLELDVLTVAIYNRMNNLFPQAKITDCSAIIREMRAVKSPYEISLIQNVADMMKEAFITLPDLIEEGKREGELAGLLEAEMRKRGHQGLVRVRGFNQEFFFGCFLSGKSGGVSSFFDGPLAGPGMNPGYPIGHGNAVIMPNQPIIVDYVGAMDGYTVDMTRVFSIGKLPSFLTDAHKIAQDIQSKILAIAVPGTLCSDLYSIAMNTAQDNPYNDNFLGFEDPVRFVGHGVGIELNELPVLTASFNIPLQEGMVIAIEPKYIFPGKGAVGVENTFLVKETGLVNLTGIEDGIVII